ncbi:hypothetical protein [Demequina lignilytica]|uniref:Uncharacterized protein n=1 Tax=Demequina lignilytica TaxID=3051663 RepID=A0AB35MJK5_9MICO|nr:hypothetical protein [Demequina sp. SYSU T0a273]MDN4484004.1 hypothetical protein [Demequina sp. SYSU T0a273]
MRTRMLSLIAVALMTVALAAPAGAQGKPDGVGGGGPPSGVGDSGLYNNLSVPTLLVSAAGQSPQPYLTMGCGTAVAPGHDEQATDPDFDGYWTQKSESTWTATCGVVLAASAVIDWGDNLTGSTALKSGKTIRVEASLLAPVGAGDTGYYVEKLTDELDRYATYGTDGTTLAEAAADPGIDLPAPMTLARVWDPGAYLTIAELDKDDVVGSTVYEGVAVAEVNSAGAIVYGFNWGQKGAAPLPGSYRITFEVSTATTLTGVFDTVGDTDLPDAHTATLDIVLTASGGKNAR